MIGPNMRHLWDLHRLRRVQEAHECIGAGPDAATRGVTSQVWNPGVRLALYLVWDEIPGPRLPW